MSDWTTIRNFASIGFPTPAKALICQNSGVSCVLAMTPGLSLAGSPPGTRSAAALCRWIGPPMKGETMSQRTLGLAEITPWRFAGLCEDHRAYISNDRDAMIDFGRRWRKGKPTSTSRAE